MASGCSGGAGGPLRPLVRARYHRLPPQGQQKLLVEQRDFDLQPGGRNQHLSGGPRQRPAVLQHPVALLGRIDLHAEVHLAVGRPKQQQARPAGLGHPQREHQAGHRMDVFLAARPALVIAAESVTGAGTTSSGRSARRYP